MNDLRATFLRELVDFIRSKLNAHIAKGGGLSEFVNGYLRIPCNEDQERRERAAQSLESRREYLEEVIFALHFAPWNAFSNHVVFFPFPFDLRIPRCVTGCDLTRFDSRAEARAFEEAAHAPTPAQPQNFPRRTLPTPSPVLRHPSPSRARSRSQPKP